MKRLIIVGSPRTNGRSAHLAEMLFEANIDEHPEDELFLVPVSEVDIGPCIGCNACRKKSGVVLKGEDGGEVTVQRYRCVFDDDMQTLYDLIDDVDEVTVVSPVYFSGAPAPMKCVLDRLQPYFWARVELRESGNPLPEKRPLTLHVIGEGGDPHGYGALVSEVRSAFATADFRLERVLDWVGKIDKDGEITAEATEVLLDDALSTLDAAGGLGAAQGEVAAGATRSAANATGTMGVARTAGAAGAAGATRAVGTAGATGAKPRPKLNLHSGIDEWDGREEQPSRKQAKAGHGAAAGKGSRGSASAKASHGAVASKQAAGTSQSKGKSKGPSKAASDSARAAKGKGPKKSRGGARGSARQPGRGQGKRRGN